MESTEEEFSSFTTKGRRTKRQRSLLAASASSSYQGGGGGGGDDDGIVVVGGVVVGGCSDNSYGSSSSDASPSDEHDIMSEVTTEEEDMANCLILLAQGRIHKEKKPSINIKSKTNNNNSNNNNNKKNNNNSCTSITSNIGVYECKTCNKTFPSFQALGGHRTSHKKIKSSAATTTTTTTTTTTAVRSTDHKNDHYNRVIQHGHDHVVDELDRMEFITSKKFIVVQTQHHRNNNMNNNNNKARVHECSICGSEFPSGQALGGHMRRHRTSAAVPGRPMMITTTTAAEATAVIDTGGPRNILSLDLNLPAPDDQDDQQHIDVDDHMKTKFVHVLPTPAPLVDCHY